MIGLDARHCLAVNSSFDIYKTDQVEKRVCELWVIRTKLTCHLLISNRYRWTMTNNLHIHDVGKRLKKKTLGKTKIKKKQKQRRIS